MPRSGIPQVIATRNSKRMTPIKEVEFRGVTVTQITAILFLLATAVLISI
jgi:hypothetical protein